MREVSGAVEIDAKPRKVIERAKSRVEPMNGMLSMYVQRGKAVFEIKMANSHLTVEMDAVDGEKPVFMRYKMRDVEGRKLKNPTGARIWSERMINNVLKPK